MTRAEYIDAITIRMANGIVKPESKTAFHPEFIARAIEFALNRVMYSQYKDRELDMYSKSYRNVDVLHDADFDMYYIALPNSIVQLPDNKGIRHISSMKSQKDKYVPLSQQSAPVFARLTSGKIAERPGFYLDGNRIYFDNKHNPDVVKVLVKIVVPFSKLDDDDIVYVLDNADEMIWQFILQYVGQMLPEDKLNDDTRNYQTRR